VDVSTETIDAQDPVVQRPPQSWALAEFERVYRANVRALTAYFARRCSDPQDVADLTSETVLQAAGSFKGFDPRRGSVRAWLFGIATHVYARHCAGVSGGHDAIRRLAGHRPLQADELEELAARIDAQRAGRELLERLAALSPGEREAVEWVDLMELSPKEAAMALGVSRGVLRMRLSRGRARIKKGAARDESL
jgi:RNA polymerase sigma factor (sigma-70 family)